MEGRKSVNLDYLLPKPVWILGCQIDSVCRYLQLTLSKGNVLEAGGLGGSMGRRYASFIARLHKFFREFTTAILSVHHWML